MINHNIVALTAYRHMSNASAAVARSIARLSSGMRINSAADDPAGLAISEKMRAQIRGLQMASRNARDGISMIQTAEGGLIEAHSMLHRVRELVIQAGSGSLTERDRRAIQNEIDELVQEIDCIAERTEFNGIKLLDGSKSSGDDPDQNAGLWLQIGANAGQGFYVTFGDMSAGKLGTSAGRGYALDGVSVLTRSTEDNLAVVDQAIQDVSDERGRMGACVNRLEHAINSLEATAENLIAAESRIRDVDMAREIMNLVRNQILYEVALAVFIEANRQAKRLVRLLLLSL